MQVTTSGRTTPISHYNAAGGAGSCSSLKCTRTKARTSCLLGEAGLVYERHHEKCILPYPRGKPDCLGVGRETALDIPIGSRNKSHTQLADGVVRYSLIFAEIVVDLVVDLVMATTRYSTEGPEMSCRDP